MARYLIAVWPADGHVNPVIPIARRLVQRGHEVVWYCSSLFQEKIERTGATFIPFTHLVNFSASTLHEHFPKYMELQGLRKFKWGVRNIIAGTMEGFDRDLTSIRQQFEPDVLIICPTFTGILPIRRRGDKIKTVCIGMLPLSVTGKDTAPFGLGIPPVDSPLGRIRNQLLNFLVHQVVFRREQQHFNGILKRLGLPKLEHWVFDAVVHYSDLYLQGTCPSFEYPNRNFPANIRFVGPFNLTTTIKDYEPPSWWEELETAKKVVLVTQGTLANTDFSQLLLPTIQALADQDILVIATTGNKPLPPLPFALPDNVRIEPFIPYSQLMPHIDLMVTNAGYGGVHYAIAYGVPLMVWGKSEDKSEVSARVEWSGIGINLKTSRVTPEQIAQGAKQIFGDPRFQERVTRMQQEAAAYDAYALSIQYLEEMAPSTSASSISGPAPAEVFSMV